MKIYLLLLKSLLKIFRDSGYQVLDSAQKCKSRTTSTDHYNCNFQNGLKIFHPEYFGSNCTAHYKGRNDFNGHYSRNKTTGLKIRHPEYYLSNYTTYCKERNDFDGHYLCIKTIVLKICHRKYYGTNCTTRCIESDFHCMIHVRRKKVGRSVSNDFF